MSKLHLTITEMETVQARVNYNVHREFQEFGWSKNSPPYISPAIVRHVLQAIDEIPELVLQITGSKLTPVAADQLRCCQCGHMKFTKNNCKRCGAYLCSANR